MKLKHIHIDKYKVFNEFDIDFCQDGKPLDLVVIAGINGSGKTTLLKEVLSGSYEGDAVEEWATFTAEIEAVKECGKSFKLSFPHVATKEDEFFPNLRFFPARTTDERAFEETILRYVDSVVYEQGRTSFEAYAEIQQLLDDIFQDFNLQIRFKGVTRDKKLLFTNEAGEQFGLEALSGGEKQVLTKVFILFTEDVRGKVILIDEPEDSMHPSWQSCLVAALRRCIEANDCQIILATHSPQIISSAKKEELRLLVKNETGRIEAVSCGGAYGWTVERVLGEIQNVKYRRVPEVEQKLDELRLMIENDTYDTNEFRRMFAEMEGLLGYSDSDLVLMRMEIIRKRKKT